jgi:UDP-N-acetylglucosamine 4,6-dehydratase/UDP-glucose 4-epimerase
LTGKKILITGGTGTLGKALTKKLLMEDIAAVRVFSRDEAKQVEMAAEINDDRARFIIGDVRDKERLRLAIEDIDIVFHAAALKQVPVAEYNPFEAVKTNVLGSQNVIDVCIEEEVELAMAISSDKAVSPLNNYGATKLVMEKLFTAANYYKGRRNTIFTAVRYGNVLGSRGSVVPKFLSSILKSSRIDITDPNMTRFNITLSEALALIYKGLKNAKGAEIFIPELKAYRLGELAEAVVGVTGRRDVKVNYSSIRPGEKMHEMLINESEAAYTIESDGTYLLLAPEVYSKQAGTYRDVKFNCVQGNYSSDKAPLIGKEDLKEIVRREIFDEENPFRPDPTLAASLISELEVRKRN